MAQPDVHSTNPPGHTRISGDQRNVLKDRTGFEDYTVYLEDYTKKHLDCVPLLKIWWGFRTNRAFYPPYRADCDILDLTKDENSLISVNLCCPTGSNSELFTALSEPQKGVYGRIVIWRTPKSHLNATNFLEDLGLALKIDPTFVKSLYAKSTHHYLRLTHIPVFVASHVMIGDRIATMTRCCITEKSSAVPIVLIADATDHVRNGERVDSRRFDHRKIEPLFQEPKCARRSGTSEYEKMLMAVIERNSAFTKPESADALILPALLAAMHMDAYSLRASCDYTIPESPKSAIAEISKWGDVEALGADCNELRRRIVEFEDVTQDALLGLSVLYGAGWSNECNCERTLEYFTETINRARRFETYVRDLCQAQIGQLSLEESRKSIELSNSQTEEGKRSELRVHRYKKLSLTGLSQDLYDLRGSYDTCALMEPSHSTCLYLRPP